MVDVLTEFKVKIKELPDSEKDVLDELDKYKELANDYVGTLEHLEKIRNIITSKEAL